jgi:ankyrin repeat protein
VDVTALHIAAQNDRLDVAQLLVARGADLDARDALYHGTPAAWAEHGGSTAVLEFLRTVSKRFP